jgi:putative ABC transport system substrate-binding protein
MRHVARGKRKLVCSVLGALLLPVAFSAEAQQPKRVAKIGYLIPSTPAAAVHAVHAVEAFKQGLRELGHIEGKTFVLELRYGQAKAERFSELARELVGLKVDVIVTASDGAIVAVKRETQTIPIVMAVSSDPVGIGLVASLARPGGNVTGLSMISPELSGKRLELLREVVPGLSRVVFLWNPDVRGGVLDYNQTAEKIRAGDQSENRQANRPDDPAQCFSESRSSYPMIRQSKIGNPKSKIVGVPPNVLARADRL